MTTEHNPYRLDKRLVRRAFHRAAPDYEQAAVLQREVNERMLERLALMRVEPAWIADVGAGTGQASKALHRRYRQARVVALDLAPGMLGAARRNLSSLERWFGRVRFVCGDAEQLPLADASMDMVYSNLTLQWCGDLDRAFAEFRRVLRPGGLLMFSTFGPDTLKELRESWAAVDDRTHVNAFIDMHDIGDAMMRAGLAQPVMDMEYFTLTYPDAMGLMRDLKAIGAHNVTAGRRPGLTGRGRLQAMLAAYERYRRDGLLPATYEVVYGHAWAGEEPARTPAQPGVAVVSLDALKRPR